MADYRFTDGADADFVLLRQELDAYLDEMASAFNIDRSQYVQLNEANDIYEVILAYAQGEPIGCASYKKYDSEIAEIKSVFVRSAHRGQGISKVMLKKLETRAGKQGYKTLLLETGEPLAAAMKVYRSLGYEVIPNYGHYVGMADSVCMRKRL